VDRAFHALAIRIDQRVLWNPDERPARTERLAALVDIDRQTGPLRQKHHIEPDAEVLLDLDALKSGQKSRLFEAHDPALADGSEEVKGLLVGFDDALAEQDLHAADRLHARSDHSTHDGSTYELGAAARRTAKTQGPPCTQGNQPYSHDSHILS